MFPYYSELSRCRGYLHKNTILTKESRQVWASIIYKSINQNLNRMAANSSNFLHSQRTPLPSSLCLTGRSYLALLSCFTFRRCCLWGFHNTCFLPVVHGCGKSLHFLLLPDCGSWLWAWEREETRGRISFVTTSKEFWIQWVIFLEIFPDPQGMEQNFYKKKVLEVGRAHFFFLFQTMTQLHGHN